MNGLGERMRKSAILATVAVLALSGLAASAAMANDARKAKPVVNQAPARTPEKTYNPKVKCPDRPNITENFYFSAPNEAAAMQEANRRLRDYTSFQGRGCQVTSIE